MIVASLLCAAEGLLAAQRGQPAAADGPKTVPLTLASTADVNPDVEGRPSPIVVRLYQLKGDTAFSRADFFALFDDDEKALGSELVVRDEYVLDPREIRNLRIAVSDEARFIGVIAAFRDLRNAEWRVAVPAPIRGLTISVERARLKLFPD
jgi:type VI secretion system protein VasD